MSIELKSESKKEEKYNKSDITFFFAEDGEFHCMGDYVEGLTLKEAFDLYDKTPNERVNGIKTIGITIKAPGNIYDGTEVDLFAGGEVLVSNINMIEFYRDHPLVQKAVIDAITEAAVRYGSKEYELNRAYLYNDADDDPIGETNFVIDEEWLKIVHNEKYGKYYPTLDIFLECYIPERDGEYIYQRAVMEGRLVADLGRVYY